MYEYPLNSHCGRFRNDYARPDQDPLMRLVKIPQQSPLVLNMFQHSIRDTNNVLQHQNSILPQQIIRHNSMILNPKTLPR